jgi:DnaK suppressor protein
VKAKPATSARAGKSASKSTATAQKAVKPSASKSAVKPAVKASAKPKPAAKVAAKPVAKKPAKPAVKAKSVVKKPVAKPAVKAKTPVKTSAKTLVKVAAKPISKVASKAAAKPVVKPVATPTPKTVSKPAPVAASKKTLAVVTPAPAPQPAIAPKPAPTSNGLPPPPPLKPGRRSSSRALAHMPPPAPMVPTHAPDAAKASYSTMTERVIAPPPHVAAKKDPKLANNWKTKTAETLTDDEVKAMPDTEYMNDKQMAFFRYKLSILKQDIHNSAGATTEHLREDTAVVPDPADRATIEEEHALELRTRDRERKLLKKIEQSIARIDSGDYGYCDETGEPIGVGRLIARPTASLSLEAQQRRELKQKMFGD